MPGYYDKVRRAARITVRAQDERGETFELSTDGMLAVCIQHEMDHLIGKVFVDYLSPLKRARLSAQAAEKAAARGLIRPWPPALRARVRRHARPFAGERRWTAILDAGHLDGRTSVLTQPDRPQGRGLQARAQRGEVARPRARLRGVPAADASRRAAHAPGLAGARSTCWSSRPMA